MSRLILFSILSLAFVGGCIQTKGNGNNDPIVSPSNTSTEVQDSTDPVLPAYIPWWHNQN